jgi:transmembrane sensor
MSRQPKNPGIDQLAADWVVRLDARSFTVADQQALNDWLAEDERHFGAYMRARAIFLQYGLVVSQRSHERRIPKPEASQPMLTRRRMLLLAGGSLAAGVAGIGVLVTHLDRVYSTRIGEVRRVPLPDGSAITLNTQTRLSVAFSDLAREVHLLRGEALFEVAADTLRTFMVSTFDTSIRSAAATFTVRALRADDVQVMVRDGEVQVAGTRRVAPVRLHANTVARPAISSVPNATAVLVAEPLAPIEVDRRLSWQRGQLSFEDVTLGDALQEFSRYSDTRVVIDEPAISQLRVVGLYSASDPVGFAKTVAISLGLRFEMRDGVAHLNSA